MSLTNGPNIEVPSSLKRRSPCIDSSVFEYEYEYREAEYEKTDLSPTEIPEEPKIAGLGLVNRSFAPDGALLRWIHSKLDVDRPIDRSHALWEPARVFYS